MHPYATLAYARTLAHIGQPLHVPPWQTHVVVRECGGSALDATGPYPITCIAPDADLGAGLDTLRNAGMVTVTLVADVLLGPPPDRLEGAFTVAKSFKTHYLVDPAAGAYRPSKHHRYEIRRAAQRGIEVDFVRLQAILAEWTLLYDKLISLHDIAGVQKFSRESFAALARCEGLLAAAGYLDGALVSCHLWFEHRNCVWSHLAASSELGYATGAAYAVYDQSIRRFSGHVIDLGGAAGTGGTESDGLARLKAGFANRTQNAYLCGAVLDSTAYRTLLAERGVAGADYFPAYRAPQAFEREEP